MEDFQVMGSIVSNALLRLDVWGHSKVGAQKGYIHSILHCSKKLKEHFFIRVWHDFSCTSLIMMWSVK